MKNETARIFAEAMRERRRALGITQRELAERISYSEKAISKWESAVALPPSSVLLPLAEALACGVEELLHRPEAVELYLGIDGGGTKTDFMLVDGEGRTVRRVILGASNPVDIGIEKTLECLSEGIREVCEGLSPRRISVFAGLAGGGSGSHRDAILKHLVSHGFAKADCGSDADSIIEAGLLADGGSGDGVVVIMGTGSVAFMREGGVKHRFGGYGYLLGDMGCGFSLGRDAICAALRDEEGTGEHTALTDLIKARTGKARVLDSLADFYSEGKRGIASYAPLLLEAYGAQDAVAARILADNVRYVADSICAAVGKMDRAGRARVVITGGLMRRADVILPLLREKIAGRVAVELSVLTEPPVKGALILAGASKLIFDGVNENA